MTSLRLERLHGQEWVLYWKWKRLLEFHRIKLQAGVYHFEDHYSLNILGLWIRLPFQPKSGPVEHMDSWAISFHFDDRCVHCSYGPNRYKILHFPWAWKHVDSAHKVLLRDGSWLTVVRGGLNDPGWRTFSTPDFRNILEIHPMRWWTDLPYAYTLKKGEVQQRTARISVERRAWRWRWVPEWIPFPRKKHQSIDVSFSDEVGERSGSWKGGCTGCGYQMKRGEEPADTLRRMELERTF